MTHTTPEGLPPKPIGGDAGDYIHDLEVFTWDETQAYAREALRAQASEAVRRLKVAYDAVMCEDPDKVVNLRALGAWLGGHDVYESALLDDAPVPVGVLHSDEFDGHRFEPTDPDNWPFGPLYASAPPAYVPADVEAPDSYESIWNALQAVDTAATQLPTFEVKRDGGIEAFTQNIVDAINEASSLLSTQHPTPEPAQAVDAVPLDFAGAKAEILAGRAEPHSLWMLLSDERERDDYALKPEVWEGKGEYQRVTHSDGRSVLVRLPFGERLPAALAARQPQAQQGGGEAARDVLAERQRQISAEGWTPSHDDEHGSDELAMAAAVYALPDYKRFVGSSPFTGARPTFWPWASEWWKPGKRRRELVKAGALILAEIERLDRAALATKGASNGNS